MQANSSPDAKTETAPPATGGPDPEKGLLSRCRTWIDVLPWLRLVRVCRLAGSPVWLTITGLLISAWWWIIGRGLSWPVAWWESIVFAVRPFPADWMLPIDLGVAQPTGWPRVLCYGATMLIAVPLLMTLARMGALLTAGRDLPSVTQVIQWIRPRLWRGYVAMSLPAACCLPLWLTLKLQIWLTDLVGQAWFTWMVSPVGLVCLLGLGLLLAGSKIAVPLAWAAVSVEPDADPIDALSRGYEYTFRRWLQMLLFVFVAALILVAVVAGWWLLVRVASQVIAGHGNAPESPSAALLLSWLSVLPWSVGVTLAGGMIGGVYLMLRQSAGGQEIEDVPAGAPPIALEVRKMAGEKNGNSGSI